MTLLLSFIKSRSGQRLCAGAIAVFFALALWFAAADRGQDERPLSLDRQLAQAAEINQFDSVRVAITKLPLAGDGIRLRFKLAETLTKKQHREEALEVYAELMSLEKGNSDAVKAAFYRAEVERDLGRLADAEQNYRAVLEFESNDVATHERLAFLLTATGRAWEATGHLLALAKSGAARYQDLALLADLERSVDQLEYFEKLHSSGSQDPVASLGLAAEKYWSGHLAEAEASLTKILVDQPSYLSAQAMLGELLLNRDAEFLKWHDALPPDASSHPRIWLVRGLWARRHKDFSVAARCYWEAIRLDPTGRRSIGQMGQVLQILQNPAHVEYQKASERLSRLTQLIDDILTHNAANESAVREVVEILVDSGRIWEACSWAVVADQQFPGGVWAVDVFRRHQSQLNDNLPLVAANRNLGLMFDFSNLPDFEVVADAVRGQRLSNSLDRSEASADRGISFSCVENAIPFTYFNSEDPATPGARSFEQTGGGVAVLDFDGDGHPDLFFPQGTTWLTGSPGPVSNAQYRDTLLRLENGTTYVDITGYAIPSEAGFGQGCAAGDFNNDGFTDLYIANVGRNQLLCNQGDGTFVDCTESADLTQEDWTASVVMADLDGDARPDLFDVNYLSGAGVYERICERRACSPKAFSGSEARLHLNSDEGSFRTVPYGEDVRPGKALGAVCFPLGVDGRLGLFISNDQVANQLLRQNDDATSVNRINLVDTAFMMGAAYNGDGVAMAGMGIAADDVDGNGLIDFYISNFKDEPNTLLLQDSEANFVDSSGQTGLKGFSLNYVGWGTQFLDADRDSLMDLVLVNGHVDDYRDVGGEYAMLPQFFHQARPMQFEERFSATPGSFFGKKRLGRGLSRLDWNQDGLMDFVVSAINEPSQLVTNTTSSPGHYLNLRLIGVTSARDAIGARVRVRATDEVGWVKPLMAGDGYMASNERIIQFGLGRFDRIMKLEIEWPSGIHTTFDNVSVDQTLTIIEGRDSLFTTRDP